jgi:hypothetical protein
MDFDGPIGERLNIRAANETATMVRPAAPRWL